MTPQDLPAVFMVSNEEEGILKYAGEILELNLSEWVLKNSSPAMGELTVDTTAGMGLCGKFPLNLHPVPCFSHPADMLFYFAFGAQGSCTRHSSSPRAS
jgi:hypothetical protein